MELSKYEYELLFINQLKNGSVTSDKVDSLTVVKPWGLYRRLDVGLRYQVKRLTIEPNNAISLQKHNHRSEYWVIVHGTAETLVGDKKKLLFEGDSIKIEQGEIHRLSNPGKVTLTLIEVQIGEYTGEDDVIRFEDNYNRI